MKTKRILLTCMIAFAVLVVTCVTVFAVASLGEQPAEENRDPAVNLSASEYVREEALAEKKIALPDGKRVALVYQITKNDSEGSFIDVYTDKDGNEYRFDDTGKVIGENVSSATYLSMTRDMIGSDERSVESAEKAEEAAREYAKTIFGDVIDDFSTVYARYDNQTVEKYYFTFSPTYGEDGFIQGEQCRVTVFANGSPLSCGSPNMYDFVDFDTDSLSSLKKESVYDYAENALIKRYGSITEGSFEVTRVRLKKVDDEIKLVVLAVVETPNGRLTDTVYIDLD